MLTHKASLNKGNMGRVTSNIRDLNKEWYGKGEAGLCDHMV